MNMNALAHWSAFAAAAVLSGAALAAEPAPLVGQEELLAEIAAAKSDVVVLDVRTAEEFAAGHVPGARNVSHDQLESRLGELSGLRDKPVVLYCRSGRRTLLAEEVLRNAGFTRLRHLEGDWLAWEAAKRPVERPADAPPSPN